MFVFNVVCKLVHVNLIDSATSLKTISRYGEHFSEDGLLSRSHPADWE